MELQKFPECPEVELEDKVEEERSKELLQLRAKLEACEQKLSRYEEPGRVNISGSAAGSVLSPDPQRG